MLRRHQLEGLCVHPALEKLRPVPVQFRKVLVHVNFEIHNLYCPGQQLEMLERNLNLNR